MARRIVVSARLRKQAKRIPHPGKPSGPCKRRCGHLRCDLKRYVAAKKCAKCGKPIGFGRLFIEQESEYRHVLCRIKR